MIVKYAEKNEKELINKIIVSAFSTKEGKKLVHIIDNFISYIALYSYYKYMKS
mgnify:CR=1 FL=1